jgi:hypothetical protein
MVIKIFTQSISHSLPHGFSFALFCGGKERPFKDLKRVGDEGLRKISKGANENPFFLGAR